MAAIIGLNIALIAVLSNYAAEAFSLGRAPGKIHSLRSLRMSDDEYTIAILGDLHLDPRFMDDHIEGREHFMKVLNDGTLPNSAIVSLGEN